MITVTSASWLKGEHAGHSDPLSLCTKHRQTLRGDNAFTTLFVSKLHYPSIATSILTAVFTHITYTTVSFSEVYPEIKCCDVCTHACTHSHIPTNNCLFHWELHYLFTALRLSMTFSFSSPHTLCINCIINNKCLTCIKQNLFFIIS